MRVTKEYDERKNEILDTAERLFLAKGYEKCTINDILKEISIAKGTFYHYFKSKEEVLDGIVERYRVHIVNRAEAVLSSKDFGPEEKLLRAFMSMKLKDRVEGEMLEELHRAENALLHEKTLNQIVTAMAPILARIVEEGIEGGIWSCKFPLQYMQIFLSSALTLTDGGIFELDAEAQNQVMAALITILERMLEVPEGSFMEKFIQSMN